MDLVIKILLFCWKLQSRPCWPFLFLYFTFLRNGHSRCVRFCPLSAHSILFAWFITFKLVYSNHSEDRSNCNVSISLKLYSYIKKGKIFGCLQRFVQLLCRHKYFILYYNWNNTRKRKCEIKEIGCYECRNGKRHNTCYVLLFDQLLASFVR